MADLVLRVLRQLWVTLLPLGYPMSVMGGIAVSMWKHIRATQDVDLLIAVRREEEPLLLDKLREAGLRAKREPPVMQLGEFRLLQLLYELPGTHIEVQVDLLMASSEYHLQALSRRIATPLSGLGMDVAVLACEDLILHKLIAGRLLDRADVGALLRANISTIDLGYLVEWANRLGVGADLKAVWREALPDRELPEA